MQKLLILEVYYLLLPSDLYVLKLQLLFDLQLIGLQNLT